MARTAVEITALSLDASTAPADGVDLDPTEGMVISPTGRFGELLIEVTHTTDAEKDVTIKAGDKPMANAAGQGDLVLTLDAGDTTPAVEYAVVSSARFAQSDGTIHIDVEADATGKIRVYQMPAGA